ncbi:hypothetical protein EIP91_009501 [Steccherinum ochraceum]|uniref:Uncharacterized protein n=1 Tax=Steccherinum ochraceum TaxID=92696 RepID=A0A4R0R1K9_9APHY|nr:hypothetical protein EIP91_009501 [Steccherinum ochraceum]
MNVLGITKSSLPPRSVQSSGWGTPPNMSEVHRECAIRRELCSSGRGPTSSNDRVNDTSAASQDAVENGGDSEQEPPGCNCSVWDWETIMPHTFPFFVHVELEDIPEELLDDAIWFHRLCLFHYETSVERIFAQRSVRSEEALLSGELQEQIDSDNGVPLTALYARGWTRKRLVDILLSPDVERFDEAYELMPSVMSDSETILQKENSPYINSPWKAPKHAALYSVYADALIFTGRIDLHTKDVLERAVEGLKNGDGGGQNDVWVLLIIRLHLAYVLERLGVDESKQREHAQWAASFLRKHPTEKYKVTSSKECQTSAWPEHKDYCRTLVAAAQTNASLGATSPDTWNVFNDSHKWLHLHSYPNRDGIINALSLNRDLSRSTTHIMLVVLRYRPDIPHLGARLQVAECGVCRIEDIREDLKKIKGWANDEEIKRQIATRINQQPSLSTAIPTLTMVLLSHLDTPSRKGAMLLHMKCRSFDENVIRRIKYDPNWRLRMNPFGAPPTAMITSPCDAHDAEHDFEASEPAMVVSLGRM